MSLRKFGRAAVVSGAVGVATLLLAPPAAAEDPAYACMGVNTDWAVPPTVEIETYNCEDETCWIMLMTITNAWNVSPAQVYAAVDDCAQEVANQRAE